MKNISMRAKVTSNKKGTEVIVTREAILDGRFLTFQNVNDFNESVKRLNSLLKTAIKREAFVEFEIITYDYELDGKGFFGEMNHGSFRRWSFSGYPHTDGCEIDNDLTGYYMQPDIRYTPAHHDMVYDYTLASVTA